MAGSPVILTEPLETLAYHIAVARDLCARIVGRAPRHGAPANGTPEAWAWELMGARAEVAFWEFTGREATVNAVLLVPDLRMISGDVLWRGHSFEVRSTDHPHGHLIVHPDSKPERFFALCINQHPTYTFPGYMRGWEALDGVYERKCDARGERNFWVPQGALTKWRPRA